MFNFCPLCFSSCQIHIEVALKHLLVGSRGSCLDVFEEGGHPLNIHLLNEDLAGVYVLPLARLFRVHAGEWVASSLRRLQRLQTSCETP